MHDGHDKEWMNMDQKKIPVIMAAMFAICLILQIISNLIVSREYIFIDPMQTYLLIFMIAGTIVMITYSKKSLSRILGTCAIIFGMMYIVSAIIMMPNLSMDMLSIISLFTLLAEFIMIFDGILFLTERVGSTEPIKFIALFLILMDFFQYLVLIHMQIETTLILKSMIYIIPRILMLFMMIAITFDDNITKKKHWQNNTRIAF